MPDIFTIFFSTEMLFYRQAIILWVTVYNTGHGTEFPLIRLSPCLTWDMTLERFLLVHTL